jgi:TPR repeat protein
MPEGATLILRSNRVRDRWSARAALLRRALLGSLLLGVLSGIAVAGLDEGIAAYWEEDYATALAQLRPLAEEGHPEAQFYVGYMAANGQGMERDEAEAVAWYERSAQGGWVKAQVNLARAYDEGLGVPEDQAAAARWYLAAAEQDHPRSQFTVATMYEQARGVDRDLIQAHKWFSIAAKQRYPGAKKGRRRVADEMTPKEIAEAELQVRLWKQR